MKKAASCAIFKWQIIFHFVCCVVLSAAVIAPGARASSVSEALDEAISPYFKHDEPGAAIIVTKDGNIIFRKAFGLADLEHNIELQPDMTFRIGSLTKQFTAVAIMILAEDGKLAVTDDIHKFLPDYPTHGARITVENLLTHTSGIRNYTAMPGFAKDRDRDLTVQQMIDLFKNEPLEFEPGTRFSYSNSGYFLLGAIIEQVSKKPYFSFIAERIFEPLGMTRTAYEGYERSNAKQAEGYSGRNRVPAISMTRPYAAGALVSCVDDLAVWNAGFSSGKLLKPESWKQIFTSYKLKDGTDANYGYGWGIGKFKNRDAVFHSGGIDGFSSYAMWLPAENVYVALLKNSDGSGGSVFRSLFKGDNLESLARKAVTIAIEN